MRRLTQAQLDEELRVGTVDLTQVQVVSQFEANLQKQAASALATVVHDTRGAESVAVADQELPYIVSESQSADDSIADLGALDSLVDLTGGDMDQSDSEE